MARLGSSSALLSRPGTAFNFCAGMQKRPLRGGKTLGVRTWLPAVKTATSKSSAQRSRNAARPGRRRNAVRAPSAVMNTSRPPLCAHPGFRVWFLNARWAVRAGHARCALHGATVTRYTGYHNSTRPSSRHCGLPDALASAHASTLTNCVRNKRMQKRDTTPWVFQDSTMLSVHAHAGVHGLCGCVSTFTVRWGPKTVEWMRVWSRSSTSVFLARSCSRLGASSGRCQGRGTARSGGSPDRKLRYSAASSACAC